MNIVGGTDAAQYKRHLFTKRTYIWFKVWIHALSASYFIDTSPVILTSQWQDAIQQLINMYQVIVNDQALMIP